MSAEIAGTSGAAGAAGSELARPLYEEALRIAGRA